MNEGERMVDYKQLLEGSCAFVEKEKRDAMYKVATYLVSEFWGEATGYYGWSGRSASNLEPSILQV